MRRRSTVLAAVLIGVAVTFAVLALTAHSPDRTQTMDERVASVAAGLRCPNCQGETVADSQSDVAQGMRAQIRSQLEEGHSPDQIRAWFAQRYGDSVLLAPPHRGVGMVVWVLPAVLLGVGLLAVALVLRRRQQVRVEEPASADSDAGDDEPAREPVPSGRESTVRRATVVAAAVGLLAVAVPGMWRSPASTATTTAAGASAQPTPTAGRSGTMNTQDWLRLAVELEDQGSYDGASHAYRKALAGTSGKDRTWIELRLAFTLLRGGHPKQALPMAEAAERGDHTPEAVLILGLAQRANHRPEATRTLRDFLRMDPHNRAAPQVRRLLRDSP